MLYNYDLDSKILQSDEALTLCRSDKALVEIGKGTLAVAIKDHDRTEGYVFIGTGRLLVDTIVETENGALGKPVQRELNEPFLMLGSTEEQSKHLAGADSEELKRMGLSQKEYFDKAQNLLGKFTNKRTLHGHERFSERNGSVFAFQNGEGTLDILLVKDSHMVYTAKDLSFVSSGDHSVLNCSGQVVLSSNGRPLFAGKAFINHDCCH